MMSSQDDMLTRIAGFGLFQKRLILIVYLSCFVCGPAMLLSSVFVVYTPPHRCYIPELDNVSSNYTSEGDTSSLPDPSDTNSSDLLFQYIPIKYGSDETIKWNQCYMYDHQTTVQDNVTSNHTTIVKCKQGWRYFARPGDFTATMEFNLVCDYSWLVTLVPTSLMLGVVGGSIFGGMLSDRFGRRPTMLVSLLVAIVSTALMAVTPWWFFIHIMTFFQSSTIAARVSYGSVLLNEITPNKHRHNVTIINIILISSGAALLPLIAYLLPHWRHMTAAAGVLQVLPLIPAFLVLLGSPVAAYHLASFNVNQWHRSLLYESPRWLMERGQVTAAIDIVKKAAKVNKVDLVEAEFLELSTNVDNRADDVNAEKILPNNAKTLSYIDLIRIAFLRRRILILSAAWFATSLSFYGLSLNTNSLAGDHYLNFLGVAAAEMPGHFLSFLTIRKLGCRLTFMLFNGLSGFFLLLTPVLKSVSNTAVVVSNIFGKLFASGCFSLLYAFTGDLFPTLLRSQSYGACSFAARVSGILVPFLLDLGTLYHISIPYLVMGATAILAVVGMYFLPETRSQPLPETMEDAKLQNRHATKMCFSKKHNTLPTRSISMD